MRILAGELCVSQGMIQLQLFSVSVFLCCILVVLLFNWLGNVLLFRGSWTHLRGSFHGTLFDDKQWPNAAYLLLMLILFFQAFLSTAVTCALWKA